MTECTNRLACGDIEIVCNDHMPGTRHHDEKCYWRDPDGLTVITWRGDWPIGKEITHVGRDSGDPNPFYRPSQPPHITAPDLPGRTSTGGLTTQRVPSEAA